MEDRGLTTAPTEIFSMTPRKIMSMLAAKLMTESPRKTEATEIEVEVLEIDGAAPAIRSVDVADDEVRRGAPAADWNHWRGRAQKLDMRWWPLWGILGMIVGVIALALLLTVGVVVGILVLLLRLCTGISRAVFR